MNLHKEALSFPNQNVYRPSSLPINNVTNQRVCPKIHQWTLRRTDCQEEKQNGRVLLLKDLSVITSHCCSLPHEDHPQLIIRSPHCIAILPSLECPCVNTPQWFIPPEGLSGPWPFCGRYRRCTSLHGLTLLVSVLPNGFYFATNRRRIRSTLKNCKVGMFSFYDLWLIHYGPTML